MKIFKLKNSVIVYSEEKDLKNNKGVPVLGLSCTGKSGSGYIKIKKDLTLPEFWDYIEGKRSDSICSEQKRLVMKFLGYTKESLSTIIDTPKKAKEFLLEHELSHVRHNDSGNEKLNKSGYLSDYRISVEARATREAWEKLVKKYGNI